MSKDKKIISDAYLGDGVYVSWDGYGFILDLRGQDDYTKITLEPEVFDELISYRKQVEDLVRAAKREVKATDIKKGDTL